MKKILSMILFFLISNIIFSENNLIEYSGLINPLLEDVKIIYEDEVQRYRILIYRGGYEHVTAYIVIQKYSIMYDMKSMLYKLESSSTIDELNKIYNFSLSSVIKNENGFLLTFDAMHSYLYLQTNIKIQFSMNLEYEIISGLVEL